MRFFQYIRYFFFIAWEWNLRIAWHIIRCEIKGERKYGIQTTGADDLHHLEDKGIDIEHATLYMPVSYDVLEEAFAHVNLEPRRNFVDIGCGKGRALCVATHYGFTKVTGIDFSAKLCAVANTNLLQVKQTMPKLEFAIINNDAFYYAIPADADCIFLFNPFDEVIMSGVVENILESHAKHPRKIVVVYANPQHKHLFMEAGLRQVHHFKRINYLEAAVLELAEKLD